MQHFSTAHTVYYNCRHQRHGYLLEGRFKDRRVEGRRHVKALEHELNENPALTQLLERVSQQIRRTKTNQ